MKLYFAKIAVFVDDELSDERRELFELIPLLNHQVKIDSVYLEKEFGIKVEPLWSSLEDVTHIISDKQLESIKKIFDNGNSN